MKTLTQYLNEDNSSKKLSPKTAKLVKEYYALPELEDDPQEFIDAQAKIFDKYSNGKSYDGNSFFEDLINGEKLSDSEVEKILKSVKDLRKKYS